MFVEGECVSVPSAVSSPETLRGLQERAARALPAEQVEDVDGWWLRHACPEGLDAVLAERGYRRQSPVSLQVASTARVLEQVPTGSLRVRLDDSPTRAWFEVWRAASGHGDYQAEWDMLARVEPPGAYVCAMSGDDVVAVGRAVADTGWAGVFGMATLQMCGFHYRTAT
ncbi:hypothetical protein GCM10010464_08090 [Pseudonocardia yunnanensis]